MDAPHCFASIPPREAARALELLDAPDGGVGAIVLRIEPEEGEARGPAECLYACWGGGSSGGADVLELPRHLCRCVPFLGRGARRVRARLVPPSSVPRAAHVELQVAALEDAEVLALNLPLLEEQVLNQWRVVQRGATMPVHVSAQCSIRLRCTAVAPAGGSRQPAVSSGQAKCVYHTVFCPDMSWLARHCPG